MLKWELRGILCDSSGLTKHPVRGSSNGTCQKTTVFSRLVHNQGDITATIGQVNEQQGDLESRSLVVRGRERNKTFWSRGETCYHFINTLKITYSRGTCLTEKLNSSFTLRTFAKIRLQKYFSFLSVSLSLWVYNIASLGVGQNIDPAIYHFLLWYIIDAPALNIFFFF